MEKLTSEDVKNVEVKPGSTKTAHPFVMDFYRQCATLGVGEGMKVLKSEWPLRGNPYIGGSRVSKGKYGMSPDSAYKTMQLADGTGWVVTRTA